MADEIKYSGRLSVTNGSDKQDFRVSGSLDQSAIGSIYNVQNIGTTYEAIDTGDLTTEGMCMLQNLDGTNFVEIGTDGGAALVPFMRLNAGEFAGPFRVGGSVSLYALADTAAVNIKVMLLEA